VEAGAGATIISGHVVARDIAEGRLTAIPVDLPAREFALVRHRDRYQSAAQSALIAELSAGEGEAAAPTGAGAAGTG
jgi:DNA-binding transcriptional LysR family regulator